MATPCSGTLLHIWVLAVRWHTRGYTSQVISQPFILWSALTIFCLLLGNFLTNLLRGGATALYPVYSDLLWEKNTETFFFFPNITVISEPLKKNNMKYYSCNLFHVFLGRKLQ